ncbi:DUF6502 family protein [Variovorax terrae]|uniref:DUF6502 family protein n=1 Tax=Variovorax terrae TaxID=2923278 RepID=A0A9X1W001_9BURK|nr:DUF6502 family protein [Variovorax terrae]MCJ0765182.1 DUF6502 family protein [Variovorax terrae]
MTARGAHLFFRESMREDDDPRGVTNDPSFLPGRSVDVQAQTVMRPLVTWLLRSGVGYAEFARALKPLFLECAQAELAQIGGKQTDSAISLLSGLHRKDVRELLARGPSEAAPELPSVGRSTPANEVVTRWLVSGWPEALPFVSPDPGLEPSFTELVRSVSRDTHPRSLLKELLRLGVAEEADGLVSLRRQAFVPDAKHEEARQLLAESVADHLAAGVHNLTAPGAKKFLEQSVFADGLSAESARALEQLANGLWRDVLKAMVEAAVPLCEKDEPRGGSHRIRLGMFCLSAPMQPAAADGPEAEPAAPAARSEGEGVAP